MTRIHGNGISTYIYHKKQLNVGKHTIHGWYIGDCLISTGFGYISKIGDPKLLPTMVDLNRKISSLFGSSNIFRHPHVTGTSDSFKQKVQLQTAPKKQHAFFCSPSSYRVEDISFFYVPTESMVSYAWDLNAP